MAKEMLLKTKKATPFSYIDGYKLHFDHQIQKWKWDPLPNMIEDQGAFTSTCYSKAANAIYLVGGASYDNNQFNTGISVNGTMHWVGRFAFKYSLASGQWSKLPNMPGTPRMNHAVVCLRDQVLVLGGASGGKSIGTSTGFKTIVDNWSLNVNSNTWKRLKDTPFNLGNWCNGVAFKDRYAILVGGMGYQAIHTEHASEFGGVWNNGTYNPPHGMRQPANDYNLRRQYSNAVVIYDAERDGFYFTDPLPINNNCPLVAVDSRYIYVIGGEAGTGCAFGKLYGQHAELVLRGEIIIK
jgi:hypothetical protein